MNTDITELLRTSAPLPTTGVNLEALQARVRRRRSRRVLARVLMIGIVVATGTGAALIMGDNPNAPTIATRNPSSGDTDRPIIAPSTEGPLSINPPAGWHSLPPGTNAGPTEILTIATLQERPTPGVVTACVGAPLPDRVTYISVYEYHTDTPLIFPTDDGSFTDNAFQPRPQSFEPTDWMGADCPDATTAAAGSNHFRMLPLVENGRRFLIRVVTTGDPNSESLAATGPILDTLRVRD